MSLNSLKSLNSLYQSLREALLTFHLSVFTFHFISCQKGAECNTRRKRRRWVVLDVRPIVAFFVRGRNRSLITRNSRNYIIPPIPAPAPARFVSGLSSFFSASTHSVVRNIEAIDAAFSRATRDTLVGSMIPAASISS